MWTAAAVYLGWVAVLSVASFTVYRFDKLRATHGGRRVPERTLQLLALLGGWPGVILAQRRYRHKTRTASFLIVFWAVVVLHVAIVSGVAYRLVTSSRPDAVGPSRPSRRD